VARSPFCSASYLLDMILVPDQENSRPPDTISHNGMVQPEPEHRLNVDEGRRLEQHRTGRKRGTILLRQQNSIRK